MEEKIASLADAAALVKDRSILAIGGNTLHRSPSALVRELARQGKKALQLVKTAGAYDVDLLCAAGCVAKVHAGFIGYENVLGLAPSYRAAVEAGAVEAVENSCYTVIAGLRAAAYGIPFQPTTGLDGSDIPAVTGFRQVADPYTGELVYAVPRLRPDWALLHVQEADPLGNGRIYGSAFEDPLMARAAKGVILTAEKIISTTQMAERPEMTAVPAIYVKAVVRIEKGALPCSCYPEYGYDLAELQRFLDVARDPPALSAYLAEEP